MMVPNLFQAACDPTLKTFTVSFKNQILTTNGPWAHGEFPDPLTAQAFQSLKERPRRSAPLPWDNKIPGSRVVEEAS